MPADVAGQESDVVSYFKSTDPSVIICGADEFQIHQTAQPVRHVGTSDRNFYERYHMTGQGWNDLVYFNAGFGQYPNLAVQDAFFNVVAGDDHHVLRASHLLADRMHIGAGPLRIEIVEPLKRFRLIVEENASGIAADLVYDATVPVYVEPRHVHISHGRTLMDYQRYDQVGTWTGHIDLPGRRIEVSPERGWNAYRNHSWGVRPVGEAEPSGVRGDHSVISQFPQLGMWNYATMQFDDFAILYLLNENDSGARPIEGAVRIWKDAERLLDQLGRAEADHRFVPGTRNIAGATIRFPDAPGGPITVEIEPLMRCYITVGTGYGTGHGIQDHWRHGKYMGASWFDHLHCSNAALEAQGADKLYVENLARFVLNGDAVGYGYHETAFIGPFRRHGLMGDDDGAS